MPWIMAHDAIGNGQVKLQLWSWIIAAQVLIQDKFLD